MTAFRWLLVWTLGTPEKPRLLFFPCTSERTLRTEIARQKRFNRMEGVPGWQYEVREYKKA